MSESSTLPRLIRPDGQEVVVTGGLSIGRSPDCNLKIDSNLVSRQHARLEVVDRQVTLTDLNSHNGTWVNEQKIAAPTVLHDGDKVRIGRAAFTFRAATLVPPANEPDDRTPVIPMENTGTVGWLAAEPLALVRGDGAEFGLNRSMTIGRDKTNDLALGQDASASQFHARVDLRDGQVVLSDLGSRNGTWVNGRRIAGPTSLKHGDKVRVGEAIFRLRVGERPLSAPESRPQPAKAGWAGWAGWVTCGLVAVGLLAVVALGAGLLFIPRLQQASAQQRALRAVVLVVVPAYQGGVGNWDGTTGVSGSGSLLDEKGIVLTNFHVIGDTETGQYHNPDGLVFIGLNRGDPQSSPDEFYRCEVVRGDPNLDLAVLRVAEVYDADSGRFHALPTGLVFTAIPIGDSDSLEMGEAITVIGFPGVGGETPTLSEGVVSGFLPQGPWDVAWIKTDTEISHGNSGGMAINQRGELIGVPTLKTTGTDYLGYIRPINLARDIIRAACPECLP